MFGIFAKNSDIGENNSLPPLIILGGTAQTINSYSPHILHISKYRRLIIPELRCQGVTTSLKPELATIQQHCEDFQRFINELKIDKIDFVVGK